MTDPWLVCPRPAPGADLRLFCFPYAGGGASTFRGWADALPENVELLLVQPPGRENRLIEPAIPSMNLLLEYLQRVLEPWNDRPFAFLGHSFGALVAFELTRERRRTGQSMPICLFALGREAPRVHDPEPPLHLLPQAEFIREFGRRYRPLPRILLEEPEIRRAMLTTLRLDFAMNETYAYLAEEPLECPIMAWGGREDRKVGRQQLEAWSLETLGRFEVRLFEGDHFFLEAHPHLIQQALAEHLSAALVTAGRGDLGG